MSVANVACAVVKAEPKLKMYWSSAACSEAVVKPEPFEPGPGTPAVLGAFGSLNSYAKTGTRLDRSLFESKPLQANTRSVKICESASSTLPPPKLLLRPGIVPVVCGTKLWKLVIGYSPAAPIEAATTASVKAEVGVWLDGVAVTRVCIKKAISCA